MLAWLTKKPKYIIFVIILADIEKALVLKKYTDFTIKVLVKYYKHLDRFLWKEVDKLLKYWLYNYKIILEEGKQPRFGLLYRMSWNELLVL